MTVRRREKITEIAWLTDESVCPTFLRRGLRFWVESEMCVDGKTVIGCLPSDLSHD